MQRLIQVVESRQKEFSAHPFFGSFTAATSINAAMVFIEGLAFWVMTFQDILRLNDQLTTDPELRRITKHHRYEDAGHERWFLSDVKILCPNRVIDANSLFSREHSCVRDAAYSLMSEVFRATDQRIRVALLLVLESSGHVFFEKIAERVESAGLTHQLKYFSNSHLAIERQHAMFEEQLMRTVRSIELPEQVYREALAMIDRAYAAFNQMFDGLERSFAQAA